MAREALACGTPVVAFPNGALPEAVEHDRTGFLVRDVDEMAKAILEVGNLAPETCRRVAAERFSLDGMISRYIELYRTLPGMVEAMRGAA